MEEVLAGLAVHRPRRGLLAGKDNPFLVVLRALVGPHVPVTEEGMFVGARRLEPRTVNRRVIDDEIDDDADAERLRVVYEVDEVAEAAVLVMNVVEIGDVVAVVAIR